LLSKIIDSISCIFMAHEPFDRCSEPAAVGARADAEVPLECPTKHVVAAVAYGDCYSLDGVMFAAQATTRFIHAQCFDERGGGCAEGALKATAEMSRTQVGLGGQTLDRQLFP
jgi:hypothetical protein